MKPQDLLRQRWSALAPRERNAVAGAAAVVAVALLWWLALAPALATLRQADAQHLALDAQLQRMGLLQSQAQAFKGQPRQSQEEAMRQLDNAVKQRLGSTARLVVSGERATVTLAGASAEALAQWLAQARVMARTVPAEARLTRNAAGLWDGTVVLSLPPR